MPFLLFFILFSVSTFADGKVRLFQQGMGSRNLSYGRSVYVYLPEGYDESHISYPVLYMQDGQNVFDGSRSPQGQSWDGKATLDRLIKKKIIAPLIVVAVDNSPDRLNEYTPENRGQGYLDFLAYELKPLIDKKFRTRTERASTGILGSSLGGLISLQAGMSHFQTFGLIGALSPSLWFNQRSMIRAYSMTQFLPERIYLDSGTTGGELPQDALDLEEVLIRREFRLNQNLMIWIQDGADHSETYWSMRFPEALKFLF